MIRDTINLLLLYLRLSRIEAGNRLQFWGRNLVLAAFAFLAGLISWAVGTFAGVGAQLLYEYSEQRFNLGAFPGVVFTIVLMMMLIWDFRIMLNNLFLSGDLERLMVAPVDTRAIFVAKLLRGIRWNYLTSTAALVPALVMYGSRLRFGLSYYVLCVLTLLLMPILSKSLAALIVMVLARSVPANRINEAYTALITLVSVGFYVVSQMGRGSSSDVDRMRSIDPSQDFAQTIGRLGDIPLPTMFLGRGVAQAGQGTPGLALLQLMVFLVVAAAVFIFAVSLAQRLYGDGILAMSGASTRKRRADLTSRGFTGSSVAGAIVRKDMLLRLRDIRLLAQQLGNGIYLLLVMVPLVVNTINNPDITTSEMGRALGSDWVLVATALLRPGAMLMIFLTGMLLFYANNLASTAIPLEGRQFTILKVAPVEPRTILFGKFLTVYIPYAALITVGLIAFTLLLHLSVIWSAYAWLAALIVGVGVIGVQQGYAAPHAELTWEDPRKMRTKGLSGLLAFVFTILFTLLLGIVAVAPFGLAAVYPERWLLWLLVGLLVLALLSGLLYLLAMTYGARLLFRLGE